MKTTSKFLTVAFVLLVANKSFAQAEATASATATIVEPISVAKTADLKFGSVAKGAAGGTVVIAANGNRTKTGDISLVNVGTVQAAAFTVTGDAGREYVLTLPSAAIEITSGANKMNVDTFTSSLSGRGTISGTIGSGTTGTQDITVGATLTVGSAQAPGSYTGSFKVTVNYY